MTTTLSNLIAILDKAQAKIMSGEDLAKLTKFHTETKNMTATQLAIYVGENIAGSSVDLQAAILGNLCGMLIYKEKEIARLKNDNATQPAPETAGTVKDYRGEEEELMVTAIHLGCSRPSAVAVVDYMGHRTVALQHMDHEDNGYVSFVLVTNGMPEPDYVDMKDYKYDPAVLQAAWDEARAHADKQTLQNMIR